MTEGNLSKREILWALESATWRQSVRIQQPGVHHRLWQTETIIYIFVFCLWSHTFGSNKKKLTLICTANPVCCHPAHYFVYLNGDHGDKFNYHRDLIESTIIIETLKNGKWPTTGGGQEWYKLQLDKMEKVYYHHNYGSFYMISTIHVPMCLWKSKYHSKTVITLT